MTLEVWSAVYGYLGLWQAAAIPVVYVVVSVLGLFVAARTRQIGVFRTPEIPDGVITAFFVLSFLGIAFVISMSVLFFLRERERTRWPSRRSRRLRSCLLQPLYEVVVRTR